MKQNKQKTNTGYKLLIILMLVIIAVSAFLGLYAWSRYTSSKPGDAVAQVAKWSFKMRAGATETTPETPFAITRTDGYGDVATDKLAPGTFGEIPVYIDMTGTEVLTKLDLIFTITDCPRNIKFYSDSNRTEELEFTQSTDGNNKNVSTVTIEKYYDVATVSDVHDETIYWGWAYETKDDGNSSTVGDQRDKEDSNNDAKLVITATGTEVLEAPPVPLGESAIKVGDTINYTRNGDTELKGIVVNKTDSLVEFMPVYTEDDVGVAEVEGYKITASDVGKARLVGSVRLGYNDGETDTENMRNQAIESWNGAVQSVNKEATRNYSLASRALTVEDVNRLVGYTPNPSTTEYTYIALTSSLIYRYIVDELTMVTTQNGEKKATELEGIDVGSTVAIGSKYGEETVQSITMKCTTGESTNGSYVYNNLTYQLSKYFGSTEFWLASRCLEFYSDFCSFDVRGYNFLRWL